MQPLLQIRVDEVEISLPRLEDVVLLTLWIDLEGNLFEAVEGTDFAVSTYKSLTDLAPIGPGYREAAEIPTFPVCWGEALAHQPTWQDFASKVPSRIAWSDTSDWFGDNPIEMQRYNLQGKCPVKLGGWPTWIQGSQWEFTQEDEDFILQIDSTQKGRIGFGDNGSIYLFRQKQNGRWLLRCDFY